jgi:hypothetical protein
MDDRFIRGVNELWICSTAKLKSEVPTGAFRVRAEVECASEYGSDLWEAAETKYGTT